MVGNLDFDVDFAMESEDLAAVYGYTSKMETKLLEFSLAYFEGQSFTPDLGKSSLLSHFQLCYRTNVFIVR